VISAEFGTSAVVCGTTDSADVALDQLVHTISRLLPVHRTVVYEPTRETS
jgi:hypothetical protein